MSQASWPPHKTKSRDKARQDSRKVCSSASEPSFSGTRQRRDNLRRFMSNRQMSLDVLASHLEISTTRLSDYLAGRLVIGNELAMHLEEMLLLPPSWLDLPDAEVPSKTVVNATPQFHEDVSAELAINHPDTLTLANDALVNVSDPHATQKELHQEMPIMTIPPMQKATLDRQAKLDARRANLVMLTQQRGSKNQLSRLAGTNPSRISLMASGRKPVSDPFAQAIEDGLGMASGWLDSLHLVTEVPPSVWQQLGGPHADSAINAKTEFAKQVIGAGTPAISNEVADSLVSKLTSKACKLEENSSISRTGNPLFIKPSGQAGPIAEALAKTVLRLSEVDQLSEEAAFQILGSLLKSSQQCTPTL